MPANSRRVFLQGMAVAGSLMLDTGPVRALEATRSIDSSPRVQPPLPFAPNALEPVISVSTVDFHYNKHHKSYFTNLDKLVAGTDLAQAPLEDLIFASAGQPDRMALFNNAAQAWNHNLYWQSLSPTPTTPSPNLAAAIQRDFGSQGALLDELAKTTIGQFGSGWGWLVLDGAKLKVVATSNAENPMTVGPIPLLVIDVWEHAYYLDHQNRRADYVNAVAKSLLNWNTASQRFSRANGAVA
jgi:Fe-Mn family superoxide dismutase